MVQRLLEWDKYRTGLNFDLQESNACMCRYYEMLKGPICSFVQHVKSQMSPECVCEDSVHNNALNALFGMGGETCFFVCIYLNANELLLPVPFQKRPALAVALSTLIRFHLKTTLSLVLAFRPYWELVFVTKNKALWKPPPKWINLLCVDYENWCFWSFFSIMGHFIRTL